MLLPRVLSVAKTANRRDTLIDRQTVTEQIVVTIPGGDTILPRGVQWVGDDSNVIAIHNASLPKGARSADTLRLQLSAEFSAKTHGKAHVHVIVSSMGFKPDTLSDSVVVLEKWIAVTAGNHHTCALAVDSLAYCWGSQFTPVSTGVGLGIGNNGRSGAATPSAVLLGIKYSTKCGGTTARYLSRMSEKCPVVSGLCSGRPIHRR